MKSLQRLGTNKRCLGIILFVCLCVFATPVLSMGTQPTPEPRDKQSEKQETNKQEATDIVENNSITNIFKDYGLPAYPTLEYLCDERAYGADGTYLVWYGFVSKDPVNKVVEFYRKNIGKEAGRDNTIGATWRIPVDNPKIILDIMQPSERGPHQQYKNNISKDIQSIIILSRLSP